MEVHVGGIAEKLNMYTAAPVNQTKTVSFPLVLSADGTQMSNATVMLFSIIRQTNVQADHQA